MHMTADLDALSNGLSTIILKKVALRLRRKVQGISLIGTLVRAVVAPRVLYFLMSKVEFQSKLIKFQTEGEPEVRVGWHVPILHILAGNW
jgi:hypothetical protein